jgi:PAS domain S-box-containing protein
LRWHRKKDGAVFPVEISGNFFCLHGRGVHVAAIRDITGRRQAEEALRRSETKFRTLYDMTGDAVMLLDEKGFLDCNPAALEIFGCATREEFCSKHPADVSPPTQPDGTDSRTLANQQIATAMEKGRHHFDWMHKRADTDQVFPADVLLSAMELDGKRVLEAVVRDITERRRMGDQIAKVLKQQQAILDVSPIGISLNKGRIIEWSNPAHCAIFGYTPEEIHGMDTSALFVCKEDYERVGRELAVQIPQGLVCTVENEFKRKDGTRFWCFAQGRALDPGDLSAGVIWMLTDITARKRTEENLRVYHEQLRSLAARVQAVREEERTRIAREIHDVLAQDLTSLKIDVSLLAGLLAQSSGESERNLVREKLAGMAAVTDTAIQSVQKIATDLRPVVLDSLGLCAAIEWMAKDFQAHTGIGCQLRLPRRELPLDHDHSTALFRILQESLTNVARHAAATQVEILLQREAGHVILTIQDNGRGIQECQANAPGAVGLMGMHERALLLGGRCDICGRPGEGTRVEARLPLPPKKKSEEKQL